MSSLEILAAYLLIVTFQFCLVLLTTDEEDLDATYNVAVILHSLLLVTLPIGCLDEARLLPNRMESIVDRVFIKIYEIAEFICKE